MAYSILSTFTAVDRMSQPMVRMTRSTESLGVSMSRIERHGRRMKNTLSPLTGMFGNISRVASSGLGLLGIGTGIGAVGAAIGLFTSEASKIEDATARFQPLMGSLEQSTKLVDELNKTAATTPFQFEGISSITGQLLPVMNKDIGKTIENFRMLGDTAGGNINKLESITRGYVKSLLKGRPDMESLNMISEAGVPIFDQLANTMGVSVKRLFEMSRQGKITNLDLEKTFRNMTSEGGLFFKGMEISSKTLSGVLSTMSDNLKNAAAGIGSAMLPIMKEYAVKVTEFVPKIKAWTEANKGLISEKVTQFFEGLKNIGLKLYNNWDNISAVFVGIGSAIGFVVENIKTISIAVGIFTAVKGVMMLAALGMDVYAVATTAAGIATNFFAAPLWAVVGIGALVASTLYVVYNHTQRVIDAFSTGGMGAGLKAVGQMLLDLILWPLEQIMKAVDFISEPFGGGGGAKIVNEWRTSLGTNPDADKVTTPTVAETPESAQMKGQATINNNTSIKETNVKIDWSGLPPNAKVSVDGVEQKRPFNTLATASL